MASPAVSTPSSAGSPAALAPTPPGLAAKIVHGSSMATISQVSSMQSAAIVTRKEWVVPPRPKPGRKPATDTPPTKRKAQNRAAQRAFRERRAARVGELEEQLEETKEEHQTREADLRDKIVKLEEQVLRFSGEVQSWKLRCDTLDRIAEYEKKEKENALSELSYLRYGTRTNGTEAVPLPPRRVRTVESKIQEPSVTTSNNLKPEAAEPLGCGNCTATSRCACIEQAITLATSGCGKCDANTHCECLEETLRTAGEVTVPIELKRMHSPRPDAFAGKRQRLGSVTSLEVDFTDQFSSKPIGNPLQSSQEPKMPILTRAPAESCGFCEVGTYCMCADSAVAASVTTTIEQEHHNRLAPILNEFTPPPSDSDAEGSLIKLPSLHSIHMHRSLTTAVPANPCVNGPGTCQQCQNDPKSGLFCRSLAAMRGPSLKGSPSAGGCCGGTSAGGGCCRSMPSAAPSGPPPSLSCADTYKTLATHKNFDQASDELNTWLGRLHATPPAQAGRAPMEVEAASVMGVLKLFDRRFGRS